MTFAAPWLLALFAPLAAVVLLLHARRRRDLAVASLPLWRRVAETTGAMPERRRFPWRDPALWLQLAALAAAVVALARPISPTATATAYLVVVDASTSMNAVDVAPSRFAAARTWVGERFAAAAARDTVTLVRAGVEANVIAAAWPVGPTLAPHVAALTPTDGIADWTAVAALAAAAPPSRVIVVSDEYGAGAARAAFAAVGLPDPDVVVIGSTLVNVGVGDVTAALRGDRADQWTIAGRLATVGFARGETLRVVAAYRPFGGDTFLPWGGVDVTLEADGIGAFEFPLDLPGPGELELRGPSGDFLPADDRAVLALRPTPTRVAIVGPRDPALLRALGAIGDLDVFAADTIPDPEAARAFDLVIVTGAAAGVPATSTLWLGAVPAPLADGAPLAAPLALAIGVHPLVADVDPTAITLARAQPLVVPEGATPILRSGDAVLGWARTSDVGRQVMIGFGPADGDWPAQLSFPAFLAAVVDRATPRSWSHEPGGCAVGAACPWPRDAFAAGWQLLDPEGAVVLDPSGPTPTPGDPLAAAVWDEAWFDLGARPERAGRYALAFADAQVGLPVVTAPVSGAPLAQGDVAPTPAPARDFAPWRVFALVAAALVIADLVLALRRRPVGVRRSATIAWTAWGAAAALAFALAAIPLAWPTLTASSHAVWVSADAPPEGLTGARGWDLAQVRVRAPGASVVDAAEPTPPTARSADPVDAVLTALTLPSDAPDRHVIVDAAILPTLPAAAWRDVVDAAQAAGVRIDVVASAAPTTAAQAVWDLAGLTLPDRVFAGSRYAPSARIAAPEGAAWRLVFERWDDAAVPASGAAAAPSASDAAAVPPVADAASAEPALTEPAAGAPEADAEPSGPVFPDPTVRIEAAGVGGATIEVPMQAGAPGDVRYRVTLVSDAGTHATAVVTVAVLRAPKVLMVAADLVQGERLRAAFEAQAIEVRTVTPFRLPNSLDALAAYDAVVLVNVPASDLFTAYQENLAAYVSERGGGLMIFGGDRTYGPGGYFRTPLDDLSPLSAQITDEAPEVSLAFVLDRSGSMNGAVGTATRLDVVKVAVLEAIELLGERSRAALIVFDAAAQQLLPFTPANDRPTFEAALTSVRAAGGTAIYPGLLEAFTLMQESDAASRHVIVMTDGLSQDGDFPAVLGALRDLGISTSFVGIGAQADRRQLATLAALSGGALHYALDFRALPSLLAQEALMLAAEPIEERPTQGDWVAGSVPSFLAGVVAGSPPSLSGYVRTTLKDEATAHLIERERDDPLLASWRYGLGRVIAFASEADGPWADAWTQDPAYAPLWSQFLRWSAEGAASDAWRIDVHGSAIALDVAVSPPDGVATDAWTGTLVELRSDTGQVLASQPLALGTDGRGLARFSIASGFTGPLVVGVPAAELERRIAWPLPPLPPVRGDLVDVEQLAIDTGGRVAASAADWPAVPLVLRASVVPPAWPALALFVFFVALAIRYGVRPRLRGARAGT